MKGNPWVEKIGDLYLALMTYIYIIIFSSLL